MQRFSKEVSSICVLKCESCHELRGVAQALKLEMSQLPPVALCYRPSLVKSCGEISGLVYYPIQILV
jgi:hypothetical protein